MGNGHNKAFKAANNQWVVTHHNTYPLCTASNIEYVDKKSVNFHIEHHGHHGEKVALKDGYGKYLTLNGTTFSNESTASDNAKFHVEEHNGKYALRTHSGKYLGNDKFMDRIHIADTRGDGELFSVHNPV
eukprot:TRINITY_DN22929_c0_g1_i2.p1 TRINITY_DN22929_c0_g1~~TRINITY_DN22929_c0_g1_i2.p1  ORF type:complete len:130 (+),score=25.13 TRINITY_DN22929_c0_g1_i2:39-428(+)